MQHASLDQRVAVASSGSPANNRSVITKRNHPRAQSSTAAAACATKKCRRSTAGSGRKFVSFSSVEVRRYPRILGDHPSCSSGPPLSIGWYHDPSATIWLSVRDHGAIQASKEQRRRAAASGTYIRPDGSIGRSSTSSYTSLLQADMIVSRDQRNEMLLELGYTEKDIAAAVRANIKAKNQRRQTVYNMGTPVSRMEEAAESAGRKIRRVFKLGRKEEVWKGAGTNCATSKSSCGSSSYAAATFSRARAG